MEATLQSPFGQTVLESGIVTIGSTPDSRLIMYDAKVSPHHAVVRPTEQGYTITDWWSTEGTFVNEQRLDPLVPRLLTAGDRIRIGETVFTYEVHEGAALIAGQGSRPEGEPAALAEPSEHTAYGAQAQLSSASPDQTQYGSAPQQEYAVVSSQQSYVLPDAPKGIRAYGTPPPPPPYTPPPQQKKLPPEGGRWKMPRRWRLFALIALILLLVGGSAPFLIFWLSTVLPAATATVTITPTSQHLTKTYTISAVTGTPDASQNQVQARALSFTTKAQSKTVKATGQGHQDATGATGTLTFSGATDTEDIPAGTTIAGGSGVSVSFLTDAAISPGNTITIKAQAVNAGSGGNIGAYDIDGTYYYTGGNPNITVYVQNTSAFTGGQDAYDYAYVQQSDIDGAAAPLVNQLTSAAQSAVQQQVHANEQFASAPECTPNIKTNHKANDRTADVTVTVTVSCKGEVYDEQATQSMASDLLTSDAISQLSDHYILVGDTVIGMPQVTTTTETGTVIVTVSADGMWVYQFSDTQEQTFAQLIAGKPLTDAQALLLKQEGVRKVSISTAGGWGSALPTSPSDIKFTSVPVPGLQATP